MQDFAMTWSDGSIEGERILKITGAFTLSSMFEFQDAMRSNQPSILIIDLMAVPYIDSAALGALIGLHVSCQQNNRHYALIGASERLQTVFRVSGVTAILTVYSSLAEAEAGVRRKAASA
jgi:anti-anti-sigma factor